MNNNNEQQQQQQSSSTFTDKRRKQGMPELLTLPDVARVSCLKILGVTIINGLSASEHVRDVISNSAQTLHALRVLRAHGMPDKALQVVVSCRRQAAVCVLRVEWLRHRH